MSVDPLREFSTVVRLFDPDSLGAEAEAASQPPPSPPRRRRKRASLQKIFEKVVAPQMRAKGRAKSTIRDVERAVEKWTVYWTERQQVMGEAEKGERIANPLLCHRVKMRHLEEWQNYLLRSASASTVNGYLGAIRQLLIAAEKRGFVKRRPMVEKLPEYAAAKHYMTREQVEAMWPAADGARWPHTQGMSPGDWWRCWFVLMWVYGFRTQELYSFQAHKVGLAWEAVSLHPDTPNPVGRAVNTLGWLTYTPQKQKWAKPQPLFLPLVPAARAALDRLRAGSSDLVGPVIPWPAAHKSFYREWHAWQKRARVTTKAGGLFSPKNLRKSASTYLDAHHRGLGASVLGHADREVSAVNAKHYTVDEITLVEQLATYRTPECFASIARTSGQLQLF